MIRCSSALLSFKREAEILRHPPCQVLACRQSWGHLLCVHTLGTGKHRETFRTLKHNKWFPYSLQLGTPVLPFHVPVSHPAPCTPVTAELAPKFHTPVEKKRHREDKARQNCNLTPMGWPDGSFSAQECISLRWPQTPRQ